MVDSSQIISIVLVFAPVIAAIPSIVGVFDVGYKDAKKRFEEIGKSLKERKIESWRYVFLGERVDGSEIAVSDEHIGNVLRAITEGESLHCFLAYCKGCFNFYYAFLLVIFASGVAHGFVDFMAWAPSAIQFINGYKGVVIACTLLYVVGGAVWLFYAKYRLDKKYEKYLGI